MLPKTYQHIHSLPNPLRDGAMLSYDANDYNPRHSTGGVIWRGSGIGALVPERQPFHGRVRAVDRLQSPQDGLDVALDRAFRQAKLVGDLFVGLAIDD